MQMWLVTVITGVLLEALGIGTYLAALAGWTGGKASPTALIPAGVGIVLLWLGVLARQPNRRKHMMHAAAAVGLLLGLASLVMAGIAAAKGLPKGVLPFASQLAMGVILVVFVMLCVKSFIDVRRAGAAK